MCNSLPLPKPGLEFTVAVQHRLKEIYILIFFLSFSYLSNAQDMEVRGTVFDPDGETLPGVNILEKDTDNGTVTNLDGEFIFQVSSPEAVLVISFIGFETQ